MFHQTLCLFDDHLGHRDVARRGFVKGRRDHFPLHRPLHVGHFFGTFVDQQDDQVALRMVRLDGMRDVLEDHRLTRPRRRNDKRPLALSDRRDQIDDPGRTILDRRILDLHLQALIRIEWRQVVKAHLVPGFLRLFKVDLFDLRHCEIALVVIRLANDAFNRVTGPQSKLTDHLGRDVDIIRTGEIVRLGRAEKPEPVLQNLQHAIATDCPILVGALLQDREHHLALTHRRGVLDFKVFGHRQKLFRRL